MKYDFCSVAIFLAITLLPLGCRTIKVNSSTDEGHLGHRHIFNSADVDRDGKLSSREIALHHHEQQLALYDLDNDHHISKHEWDSAHPSAADEDRHFNRFDKNADGHVCKDEAVLFVTEPAHFGDAMKKFDQNGDFYLHWNEIDEAAPTELRITLFSFHPGFS